MTTGAILSVPLRLLEGISDAPLEAACGLELEAEGTIVSWKQLDDGAPVESLLLGIYGSRAWMRRHGLPDIRSRLVDTAKIGREGGRVKSAAKARAAALNGKKGGRPKKAKLAA